MNGSDDFLKFSRMTLDPSFKGGVATSYDKVLQFNSANRMQSTFKVLERPLITFPVVIYLRKNSYLTKSFNVQLGRLKNGGIIEYWMNTYYEMQYLKFMEEKVGPKAMSLKTLSCAFMGLTMGLIVSLIAFASECLICLIFKKK